MASATSASNPEEAERQLNDWSDLLEDVDLLLVTEFFVDAVLIGLKVDDTL